MEATSQCSESEGGATKTAHQSQCISTQPAANGTLPHHEAGEAPPPVSDTDADSLIDSSLTDGVLPPLPAASPPRRHSGMLCEAPPPAVCSPPASVAPPLPPCHHPSSSQKRLSSTRSHAASMTDAAHIKQVAGDDCCAHCLLACLFCELPSLCSALGACLACGGGGDGCCEAAICCCCCVEAAGEAACAEEACQAVLDCGILEDCCSSADCLEICLECCSICFPS